MTRYVFPLLALVALTATTLTTTSHFTEALAPAAHAATQPREITITVHDGYTPNRIEIIAGERVRLVFTRTEYTGCTLEVVFPALAIRTELPPHTPVTIDLPALLPGAYDFSCGMGMIHGTLVVTAPKG